MNVSCSHCQTVFRVDPAKVPARGVRARCSICKGVFRVPAPPEAGLLATSTAAQPASMPAVEPAPAAAPAESPQPVAAAAAPAPASGKRPFQFGSNDPEAKARRLARALVSDMVTYHPARRERGLQEGTLKQEFREEIRKSWEEYVEQVGREMAHGTTFFRDALNEILARGQRVF